MMLCVNIAPMRPSVAINISKLCLSWDISSSGARLHTKTCSLSSYTRHNSESWPKHEASKKHKNTEVQSLISTDLHHEIHKIASHCQDTIYVYIPSVWDPDIDMERIKFSGTEKQKSVPELLSWLIEITYVQARKF
jgi:hypothetical protein